MAHCSYTTVMQGASVCLKPCAKSIRQWPHERLLDCPARSGCALKIHHSATAARCNVRYTARHAQLQSQTERFVRELEEQGFEDADEGVEEEELSGQAGDLQSQLESLKHQVSISVQILILTHKHELDLPLICTAGAAATRKD